MVLESWDIFVEFYLLLYITCLFWMWSSYEKCFITFLRMCGTKAGFWQPWSSNRSAISRAVNNDFSSKWQRIIAECSSLSPLRHKPQPLSVTDVFMFFLQIKRAIFTWVLDKVHYQRSHSLGSEINCLWTWESQS